jgi:hypothetical protein
MGMCWLYSIWNSKKVVGALQMQMYSEAYLKKYNNLVERAALPKYRKEFADYDDAPFVIDTVISSNNGAAIKLIPSDESKFKCRTISEKIDEEIFNERKPNNSIVERDKNVLDDLGYPSIDRIFRVSAKDISITRLRVRSIILLETGSLITKEMVVGGIYYPDTIIVKGSNQRKHWNLKVARKDASISFRLDLIIAYLSSQEFREFIATPELTLIAKDIIAKRDKGSYSGEHGYILFREDLGSLIAKAEEHGISHEFAESIYKFLETEQTWLERHKVLLTVLLGILSAAIFTVLVWFLKWIYNRFITGSN